MDLSPVPAPVTEWPRRAPMRALRALLTIPVEASGVSQTCVAMLRAAARSGRPVSLHAPLVRWDGLRGVNVTVALPRVFRGLPYRLLRTYADTPLQARFIAALAEGEVAYLWPDTPLETYEKVARRGNPIVIEAVNTRMAVAKEVLDAAYDALGSPPLHGITAERIAVQAERTAMCSAVFAPSAIVEASYAGTPAAGRLIAAGYGTWVPETLPERPPVDGRPVRFLFVGRDGVRKGLHHLLEVWRNVPEGAELRIVGEIPPLLQELYGDVLNQPSVSAAGFTEGMAAEYAAADVAVLPSLEEGDPIATYEAAAHGLPVIATVAGAGRFGAETGLVDMVVPGDVAAIRDAVARYTADAELRRHQGARLRAASFAYDWSLAGPARFAKLDAFLAR
ncbi:glycosyltransferase involved in cell wall biosynthesis [Defluviimonas denitrificans]|uniref:Glycosyltransferase involved in cell wall biosynthesis n=1 Tax=Albidovulum denitrificans TaxID=404881 RepID=A0A2S8S347_9RHOB|nr:glycosyltransferase [Defluviimonas denitrificans]PQV55158.1 glycosyltransferase involved in cell wall biosynthesis [Defluviimonas denitrificans]